MVVVVVVGGGGGGGGGGDGGGGGEASLRARFGLLGLGSASVWVQKQS